MLIYSWLYIIVFKIFLYHYNLSSILENTIWDNFMITLLFLKLDRISTIIYSPNERLLDLKTTKTYQQWFLRVTTLSALSETNNLYVRYIHFTDICTFFLVCFNATESVSALITDLKKKYAAINVQIQFIRISDFKLVI